LGHTTNWLFSLIELAVLRLAAKNSNLPFFDHHKHGLIIHIHIGGLDNPLQNTDPCRLALDIPALYSFTELTVSDLVGSKSSDTIHSQRPSNLPVFVWAYQPANIQHSNCTRDILDLVSDSFDSDPFHFLFLFGSKDSDSHRTIEPFKHRFSA
jgi:hypothetical protein